MAEAAKQDRGQLRIDDEECKGCALCIEACPPKVISMSERLNHYGYNTALYAGAGCTGCGICFMVCPEPGAITVYRLVEKQGTGIRDQGTERPIQEQALPSLGEEHGARPEGASACASN